MTSSERVPRRKFLANGCAATDFFQLGNVCQKALRSIADLQNETWSAASRLAQIRVDSTLPRLHRPRGDLPRGYPEAELLSFAQGLAEYFSTRK